jgi:hypothetical protein
MFTSSGEGKEHTYLLDPFERADLNQSMLQRLRFALSERPNRVVALSERPNRVGVLILGVCILLRERDQGESVFRLCNFNIVGFSTFILLLYMFRS